MLNIYKGPAYKPHENDFFYDFAENLKNYFSNNNFTGFLLGFPTCLLNDSLQIDALLITKAAIVIIDFKDYKGEIILPDEGVFLDERWRTSDGIYVEGGSTNNPFRQLGKQRNKLYALLSQSAPNIDSTFREQNISTVVCFSNPVKLNGNKPRKYRTFFIANSEDYIRKLSEIIDVENKDFDFLNKKLIDCLFHEVFNVRNYDSILTKPSSSMGSNLLGPTEEISSKTITEDIPLDLCFESFLNSDNRVMISTGSAASSLHNYIHLIREIAFNIGYKEVKILALSNRVRNNLLRIHDGISSIYSTIYNFSAVDYEQSTSNRIFPCNDITYSLEEDEELSDKEYLYIILESQMVSDSYREDPLVKFGSGRLLSDLIHHLKLIEDDCPNKVIFMGDNNQLSFGSWNDSSLNYKAFQKFNIEPICYEFPNHPEMNEIETNCLEIANSLSNDKFFQLQINPGNQIQILNKADQKAAIESLSKSFSSKLLVYTNQQAKRLNSYIKNNILKNGLTIAPGDLVFFDNQVTAIISENSDINMSPPFSSSSPFFKNDNLKLIDNGTFGLVEEVYPNDTFTSSGSIKDSSGKPLFLSFMKISIKLIEEDIVIKTYILTDFIASESTKLNDSQEQEYQAFLQKLFAQELENHPFEQSHEYQAMIKDNGSYFTTQNGSYRDISDKRSLTTYEKAFRKRIRKQLIHDEKSKYFIVFNAARLKFGWCLTVHKSMSYEWDEVYFSTDIENRGRTNAEFFRFMYTGLSRAKQKVNLIRWKPVSPFEKTSFEDATNIPRRHNYIIEGIENLNDIPDILINYLRQALLGDNISIINHASHNYQEAITFSDDKGKIVVASFHYKKEGNIKFPSFVKGDEQLYLKIKDLIIPKTESILDNLEASPMSFMYKVLQRIISGLIITLIKSSEYQDFIEVSDGIEKAIIQVWYTKDNLISHFNFADGSKALYNVIRNQIGDFYGT